MPHMSTPSQRRKPKIFRPLQVVSIRNVTFAVLVRSLLCLSPSISTQSSTSGISPPRFLASSSSPSASPSTPWLGPLRSNVIGCWRATLVAGVQVSLLAWSDVLRVVGEEPPPARREASYPQGNAYYWDRH